MQQSSASSSLAVRLDDSTESSSGRAYFTVLTDLDLEEMEERPWLVEGMLPSGAASAIIAPPASAKTFAAVDLAFHVATGLPWHGRKVTRGNVVYIAAEGQRGLRKRVMAWKKANHYLEVCNIYFVPEPVQLLDKGEVERLLTTVEDYEMEPALIVVDTFARCFLGGDENSASTMGNAVEAMRRLQVATGATVLLVHHTRKGDTVERGSSALRGALDTIITARKDGQFVTISCGKMKDAPEFPDVPLRLVTSEPSCTLELVEDNADSVGLSSAERVLLDVLANGALRYGDLKREAAAADVKFSTFQRARKSLLTRGLVIQDDTGGYRLAAVEAPEGGTTSTRSYKTGTVEPAEGDDRALTLSA